MKAGEVNVLTAEPAEFSGVGEAFLGLCGLFFRGEFAAVKCQLYSLRKSFLALQRREQKERLAINSAIVDRVVKAMDSKINLGAAHPR